MKSSKNSTSGLYWGELPPRETHKQEVITPDIIENIWRQVLDDSNSTECDYQTDRQPDYIQLPMKNPHVMNTVNYHHQLRTMDDGQLFKGLSEAEIPEVTEEKKSSNLFNFLSPKPRIHKLSNTSTIHHLRPNTARSLLKHAIIVLTAHIGFELSSDIAIETLCDVVDNFFKRLTRLLNTACERNNPGFPDVLERVLTEAGVGNVVDLHDYYQSYVLKFEEKMKKKVEIRAEKQKQLELSTTAKMELDDVVSKLQFEEIEAFGNVYRDVPTLQLLDPDMGFPPSLDAGFQMLHSLEQDELNSLEVEEEDVTVSGSPQHADKKKKKDC